MRGQTGFLEGPFHITENGKAPLCPPAIGRVLRPDKKKPALKGKGGAKPGKTLKKQVPACVRNFAGCCRFSAASERGALAAVYRPLRPLLNFFMPNIKLLSKTRVGAHLKKAYDKNTISPYRRLPAPPDLAGGVKAGLAGRFERYNPVALQQEAHRAVDALVPLNRAICLERGNAPAVSALHAVWLRLDFILRHHVMRNASKLI
ncbi:MAG: hypothetical protein LBH43_19790 [Treponema sp.]|jgi:hypothetical protein|nr:hypothetical protein [Treponema sp.]